MSYEPPSGPGKRDCLKCTKPFQSTDLTKNRICPKCSEVNRTLRVPRILPSWIDADGKQVEIKPEHEG